MTRGLALVCAIGMLAVAAPAWAQIPMHWDEGAADCATSAQPSLQVYRYDAQTFILRENPCATFEAPFMYLLAGSTRAVLIDDGDVADPRRVPLVATVTSLTRLPLLVVHTHRHLDHRGGDAQFAGVANAEVVGYDLEHVKRYYHFTDWPNGVAHIDLGDRVVDVLPTPGHNETHVAFYDERTGLFFSGDFLMPGRLLIDDAAADLASATRVAAFVKDRPVAYVLGGHIEVDTAGKTFPWESTYHPHEHALELTKADLLALPAALASFNGFYTERGPFIMMNSMRVLIAVAVAAAIGLGVLIGVLVTYLRRRRGRTAIA